MTSLAVMLFLALATFAAVHVAWGFGLRWPAQHERDLVALVVGRTGQTRMPGPIQCFAAGAALFCAGLVALAMADLVRGPGPRFLATTAGAIAVLVFAGRGIAAYLPAWRRRFSQQPFAAMDQSWYAPLCLLLAVAFGLLVARQIGGWA
jgi:uncharacterized protein DUF3995